MAGDALKIEIDVETRQAIAGLAAITKGLKDSEEGAKKSETAIAGWRSTLEKGRENAEKFTNQLSGVVSTYATLTRSVIAGAAAHEQNERALRTLGGAYDNVARQTRGAFTAAEALRAQQGLVQSGLQLSGEELGRVTRAAREYALATGTESVQALDQLTDALRGGEAEGLRRFGITLEANTTRSHAFRSALTQLGEAQRTHAPEAQTMAEANAQLGRSWDQLTNSLMANVAQWTSLRDRMAAAVELMGEVRESGLLNTLTGNTQHTQQNAASTARLNNRVATQERYNDLVVRARGIAPDASFGHARSMTDAQLEAANTRLEALVARAPVGALLGAAPSGARGAAMSVLGGGSGSGLVFGPNGLSSVQDDVRAFAGETAANALAGDAENARRVREGRDAARRAQAERDRHNARSDARGPATPYDSARFDLIETLNELIRSAIRDGNRQVANNQLGDNASLREILDQTRSVGQTLEGPAFGRTRQRRGESDATFAPRLLAAAESDRAARATRMEERAAYEQSLRDKANSSRDLEWDADQQRRASRRAMDDDLRTKATGTATADAERDRRGNVGAQFRDAFLPAALETQTAAEKMAEGVSSAFQTMTGALKSHIGAVIEGRETIGQALKAVAHETLMALATEAVGRSLMSLAGGLAALAVGSPTAPLLFASAAAYAGVAALAGVGAAATAAPAAATAGTSRGGIPAAASAGGGGSREGGGSNTYVINVNGTVMDREGTADAVRDLLNDSLSRGGQLRAAA